MGSVYRVSGDVCPKYGPGLGQEIEGDNRGPGEVSWEQLCALCRLELHSLDAASIREQQETRLTWDATRKQDRFDFSWQDCKPGDAPNYSWKARRHGSLFWWTEEMECPHLVNSIMRELESRHVFLGSTRRGPILAPRIWKPDLLVLRFKIVAFLFIRSSSGNPTLARYTGEFSKKESLRGLPMALHDLRLGSRE